VTQNFKDAGPQRFERTVLNFLVGQVSKNNLLGRKLLGASDSIDFVRWRTDTFGSMRFFERRELLWDTMAATMTDGVWTGFEFGVAHGYLTSNWMQRPLNALVAWHGFDRFTGLPRAWRGASAGAFDNGGVAPSIDDPRLTWHVGDVEDTLPRVAVPATRKLIFFDLDIYEPTKFAFEYLKKELGVGDLLYFDEAFDPDERTVIVDDVLATVAVEPLGATAAALGLRITGIK
jgi:hypothetical protein